MMRPEQELLGCVIKPWTLSREEVMWLQGRGEFLQVLERWRRSAATGTEQSQRSEYIRKRLAEIEEGRSR